MSNQQKKTTENFRPAAFALLNEFRLELRIALLPYISSGRERTEKFKVIDIQIAENSRKKKNYEE